METDTQGVVPHTDEDTTTETEAARGQREPCLADTQAMAIVSQIKAEHSEKEATAEEVEGARRLQGPCPADTTAVTLSPTKTTQSERSRDCQNGRSLK